MITLAVPDPLQTSLRLALIKGSFSPVYEDTLVPKRLLTDYQPIRTGLSPRYIRKNTVFLGGHRPK